MRIFSGLPRGAQENPGAAADRGAGTGVKWKSRAKEYVESWGVSEKEVAAMVKDIQGAWAAFFTCVCQALFLQRFGNPGP